MKDNSSEKSFLKGYLQIFSDPVGIALKNRRYSYVAGGVSLVLIFAGGICHIKGYLEAPETLFMIGFGGVGLGFGYMYRISAEQIPFLVKYHIQDSDQIKSRLEEMEELKTRA